MARYEQQRRDLPRRPHRSIRRNLGWLGRSLFWRLASHFLPPDCSLAQGIGLLLNAE
jgi:hypothetical protein